MYYRSSCPIKIWPCILAPAITGLMLPSFACLVPWSFLLCLHLVWSELAGWSLVLLWFFSTFSSSCSDPHLWWHFLSREMCSCSSFDRNGLCHKAANLCSSLAPLLLQPFGAKPLLGYLWRVWVPGQHTWELCPITAEGQWQNLFTWVRIIHQAHTVNVVSWGSPASSHPLLADTWQDLPTWGKSQDSL